MQQGWMLCYNYTDELSINTLSTDFVLGNMGSDTCSEGDKITVLKNCRAACAALGKKTSGNPAGMPCYLAGNDRCNAGRFNRRSRLVCKTFGNLYKFKYNIG